MEDPFENLRPLFGDLHNHCGISYGHGSLEDALANAREQLDFAEERGWALDRAELIKALAKPQARNRGLDAYVRWQLLSFDPDFSKMTTAQMDGLIRGMARMEGYPNTVSLVSDPGSQPGNLVNAVSGSVGNQRVGLDRRSDQQKRRPPTNAEIVEATNAKLAHQHAQAKASNALVVRYREALIGRLPDGGAAKLTAMIEDLRTRVEAGDPSHVDAAKRLLAASEKAKADTTLTADQRKKLSDAVAIAAGKKWPVVEKVKLTGGGQITYEASYAVVDPNTAVQIRKNLLTATK